MSQALAELKTAQEQLLRREKMAFLGELTAGIAHELQNPLNFVANFAGVSAELAAELLAEVALPVLNREGLQTVARDLQYNQERIRRHGLRASAIVRDMLEHSRIGPGQRAPCNLNALAEEMLTLAYQNLCASDQTFRATLRTDLDPRLGTVPVVAPDICRTLFQPVRQRLLRRAAAPAGAGCCRRRPRRRVRTHSEREHPPAHG